MDFNFEFDYLNGTLNEWLDKVDANTPADESTDVLKISTIESEYLPRFEAAIYRNLASQMLTDSNLALEPTFAEVE